LQAQKNQNKTLVKEMFMADVFVPEKPLSIDEAAEFLNLKKSYLYKLCCTGKISCYRPGGKRLIFKIADLNKYLYRHRQSADFEIGEEAARILNGEQHE
jgi:excisionase family DNA binding protein